MARILLNGIRYLRMDMKSEIRLNFQLKSEAKDVDKSSPFYEKSKFWFGLLRYVTEGANFLLIGLFWLNGIARKRGLRQFNVLPKQSGIAWIMAMSVLVSLVVYMMTLTSDILEDILSFKLEVIMQFPYILSSISLIILFILFILKDMEKYGTGSFQ